MHHEFIYEINLAMIRLIPLRITRHGQIAQKGMARFCKIGK